MEPQESIVKDFSHSHLKIIDFKGEHAAISGIGIVHGLASNDELLLLLTLSLGLSSYVDIFIGLLIFTIGVVIGMVLFSVIIRFTLAKHRRERVIRIINVSIALVTLAYGIYSLTGGATINILPLISDDLTGTLYVVAIILGIKHSVDADHVVAISSILLRAKNLKKSITLSISWAFGHMITASIITFILFGFKELILDQILANFEMIVAIMLIVIAVLTLLWEFNVINFGKHSHGHEHTDGSIHAECKVE